MKSNYDLIAPHYDLLSRLVFGKAQVNAQIQQLKYISENSKVLIVGGGTGWILEEIAKIHPKSLEIYYVEISAKMLKLSEKRNFKDNSVHFLHQSIEDFKADNTFDFILTPFLFDNFEESKAGEIFLCLHQLLKARGKWLFVDFVISNRKSRWWNLLLLKTMYLFFRCFNIIDTQKLTDMSVFFAGNGYEVLEENFFYRKFIQAVIYQK